MAICPRGHNSIADDFCDACGRPIGQQAMPQQQYPASGTAADYARVPGEPCPVCHTPRDSATRFCEACGHEFDVDPGGAAGYGPGPAVHYAPTEGGGQGYSGTGYDYGSGQQPQAPQQPQVPSQPQPQSSPPQQQPEYLGQGGYPDQGGYPADQGGYGGQSGQSTHSGHSGQSGHGAPGGHGGHGGHSGQGTQGGLGGHSGQTSHDGRPAAGGYPGQQGTEAGGGVPGQASAPPAQQSYGYAPQTTPPAGYPPGESYSSGGGGYQEQAYAEEWGGGTVVGSGPVTVPPRPPMLPSDYHPGTAPPHGSQAPPGSYVWTVRVTADPEYFDRVVSQGGPDAHAMRFPPYHEAWTAALEGDRMRVGRRRAGAAGVDVPEIDLSGPPSDPGISHLHVVLLGRQDGSWQLVDPGSTNGTTLNGGKRAIEFNLPVDLHDGDRIHVGAWTTLEVNLRAR